MDTKDYINIGAILLSPVIAVCVTLWYQGRKEKRDRIYRNKFSVFACIIGERHAQGSSRFFITSINQITIVFNSNDKVITAYKKFIDEHNKKPFDQATTIHCLNDLIVEMGRDLGYEEMNNTWIASYFYPYAAWAEFTVNHHEDTEYIREHKLDVPNNEEKK